MWYYCFRKIAILELLPLKTRAKKPAWLRFFYFTRFFYQILGDNLVFYNKQKVVMKTVFVWFWVKLKSIKETRFSCWFRCESIQIVLPLNVYLSFVSDLPSNVLIINLNSTSLLEWMDRSRHSSVSFRDLGVAYSLIVSFLHWNSVQMIAWYLYTLLEIKGKF